MPEISKKTAKMFQKRSNRKKGWKDERKQICEQFSINHFRLIYFIGDAFVEHFQLLFFFKWLLFHGSLEVLMILLSSSWKYFLNEIVKNIILYNFWIDIINPFILLVSLINLNHKIINKFVRLNTWPIQIYNVFYSFMFWWYRIIRCQEAENVNLSFSLNLIWYFVYGENWF